MVNGRLGKGTMKLSTKGRYAMIALVDIAREADGGLTTLSGISERQGISLAYLEQLFVKLRRAEVVESARGPVHFCARLCRRKPNKQSSEIPTAFGIPPQANQGHVSGNIQPGRTGHLAGRRSKFDAFARRAVVGIDMTGKNFAVPGNRRFYKIGHLAAGVDVAADGGLLSPVWEDSVRAFQEKIVADVTASRGD